VPLGSIRYPCGVRTFAYKIATQTVTVEASTEYDHHVAKWASPRRHLSLPDALTFAVGGLQAYQLPQTIPKYIRYVKAAQAGYARRIIHGFTSLITGVGIGVFFGYENEMDCGSKPVQDLLGDPAFWAHVQRDVAERYVYHIGYYEGGLACLDPTRGAGLYAFSQRGAFGLRTLSELRDRDADFADRLCSPDGRPRRSPLRGY
jgi:hypothetical protein